MTLLTLETEIGVFFTRTIKIQICYSPNVHIYADLNPLPCSTVF